MFKRFTDCHKWQDPWFRKLSPEHKLFWLYLCDHCDNAGVWKVDFETAAFFIGAMVDAKNAIAALETRVQILNHDNWLIIKFVDFQFGGLSRRSPLHKAVLKLMDKHTLTLGYPKPSIRLQVKEKEKDKEKDKEKVKDVKESQGFSFDTVWDRYPRKLGRKAAERHFKASVKTPQDFLDIQNGLDCFIRQMRKEGREEEKIQYGSTWFCNWRDWVNYGGLQMPKPITAPPVIHPPDPPEPTEEERLEAIRVFKNFRSNIKMIPQVTDAELEAEKKRMG